MGLTQELPVREKADGPSQGSQPGPINFGRELKEEQFLFDPTYRNLNHGISIYLTHLLSSPAY
jgi:hypothetical protein